MSGFVSLAAVVIVAVLIFLVLFEPTVAYRARRPAARIDSCEFVNYVSAIVNARPLPPAEVRVLNDGEQVFAAELRAIREARRSIHLEVYLLVRGRVADEMLAALEERARNGVRVRLIIDRYGSLLTPKRYFDTLLAAGGEVRWYQPIAWYTLKRLNNRTHRDLLVVDGAVAFVGGIGVADYWVGPRQRGRPWRDTMIQVSGALAMGLQTSFAENWLEAAGEILPDTEFEAGAHERDLEPPGPEVALVVNSAPSEGRSTRARTLFQILVASARESICIASPYFIPDRRLCEELVGAVRRGVCVTVLVPGRWNNHPLTRLASRRRYGQLLEGGVAIHEYQPAMMHAKILIVDHVWSVVGSTNFDNRSFGLNDEVNVAILQKALAARLEADFAADLAESAAVTLEEWRRRALAERAFASFVRLLERQA
ncbi:MAG TPA: phospholipase D-like domain-containing protein [Burkholderiales bacterium]|jgi:cardiolipin synthase|nr:phospholipase D-like domain-containing protein [Burkholderiales bacterium]